MRLGSWRLMSVLLAASLLVSVVSCGTPVAPPPTEEPSAPTPTQATAPAETPTTAAPPEPEEKPVIVVAVEEDADNINPQEPGTMTHYYFTENLYEGLLEQTLVPDEQQEGLLMGAAEYLPGLADDVTFDEENNVLTFHIPDGRMFANGNPITAQSYKFMVDLAWLMPTSMARAVFPFVGVDDNTGVVAVDDNTLEFHLKRLTPLTYALLSWSAWGALDQQTVEENATAEDQWAAEWLRLNANPSGPYMITKWEPGVEYDLEPNPNYWQGEDYFNNSRVIVRVVPSAEDRELLLRQGDVDLAANLPYKDLANLEMDPNVKVYSIDCRNMVYLGMNTQMAPFDNKALRQAISYAVPYDTIIEEVYYGHAKKPMSPFPIGMPTHTDEFWPYETDLEKAKEKLAEAGYPEGLDVELAVRANRPTDIEAATWIQSSLGQIGVNVTISVLAPGQYFQRLYTQQLPFFFWDWASYGNDPSYHLSFIAHCGSFTNWATYCNTRLDELIDTAAWSLDPDEKEAGMREAQQIIVEDAPWVFLAQPDWIVAVNKDFYGFSVRDQVGLYFPTMGKSTE